MSSETFANGACLTYSMMMDDTGLCFASAHAVGATKCMCIRQDVYEGIAGTMEYQEILEGLQSCPLLIHLEVHQLELLAGLVQV